MKLPRTSMALLRAGFSRLSGVRMIDVVTTIVDKRNASQPLSCRSLCYFCFEEIQCERGHRGQPGLALLGGTEGC
jgi:hypothetical protein